MLTNDNKCHAIGRKEYGRLGLGALTEDVEVLTLVEKLADKVIKEISCGESCSFAVTEDGKFFYKKNIFVTCLNFNYRPGIRLGYGLEPSTRHWRRR